MSSSASGWKEKSLVEGGDLLLAGVGQVEPEVLVALQQVGDRLAIDAVEEAHAANARSDPGRPGRRQIAAPARAILLRSSALGPVDTGKVCV